MSEEGSSSLGACYIPTYPLSESYSFKKYTNFSAALHFDGLNKDGQPTFFHDHTLVNWGIFTMPRHPVFARTLQHIVEIVYSEYNRVSVVHLTRWDVRWKQVMCTTGFTLTYTVRELELERSLPEGWYPRICVNNYNQYKGNVKAIWTGGDPNHYMKAMQRKNGPHILKELVPLDMSKVLEFLHGRTVMGDAGKEIYLIYHGKKYTFGSYEIFLNMNFTDRETRHVHDLVLNQVPLGGQISSIEDFQKEQALLQKQHLAQTSHQQAGQAVEVSAHDQATAMKTNRLFLKRVVKTLNNRSIECFGDDYDGTRDDYMKGTYHNILGDVPVMIYPFCARTYQLGNCLGYYLNDVACADISGAHFVAVHKDFNLLSPQSLVTKGSDRYAFLNHLPDLIVHPNPKTPDEVKSLMKTKCDCLQFCWENSVAPWTQRIPLVSKVIATAIHAYEKAAHVHTLFTELNNETDISSIPEALNRPILPLVPNVTIQYRCGDNIGFGKTKYGLLPFSVYNLQRIQEDRAQYIYVIADSPSRNAQHAYSFRCGIILKHLYDRLRQRFPMSVVVVKRGGDPFLDYVRLFHSSVVFCSASTFCLWPALANRHGQIYYPLTPLIAGAATNTTAPKFTRNFHWIDEVDMIKQFKHYRPWTQLIDDLEK